MVQFTFSLLHLPGSTNMHLVGNTCTNFFRLALDMRTTCFRCLGSTCTVDSELPSSPLMGRKKSRQCQFLSDGGSSKTHHNANSQEGDEDH